MKRKTGSPWWGLYLLVPITVALLYLVAGARVGNDLRRILLVAVVVMVAGLALGWSEKHADLMGSQGVNARAEEDALKASGRNLDHWAPSLTGRQAHYRQVMLAQDHERTAQER